VDSVTFIGKVLIMYGKHFASMYEGSMVGAGAVVFAVMGYVIAKQEPDKEVGSQVSLNPILLATILGEKEADIERAVKFLCSPDPKSTTPDKEGRRLVKIGQFSYQVVNGAKYRAIRDQETRREQNRQAKRRQRSLMGRPIKGEPGFVEAIENGESEEHLDRLSDPEQLHERH